ncbi:NPCBM/NEW2 domain-containing protein [Streptomyces pactum]|uniref:NPCBM/NEW2 domain-containing protein n=1 Tax=Streptomyces pactum TaxID=68249 RepID=UPI003556DC7C
MRRGESSWMWQRSSLSIGGRTYPDGVTVAEPSSLTIDLNRPCTAYRAVAGIDDLSAEPGSAARFAVYADGVLLWRSRMLHAGEPAVPVSVGLSGRRTVRLVVERHGSVDRKAMADWADSSIDCS